MRRIKFPGVLILLLLLVSCAQDEFYIDNTKVQTFVSKDGHNCLALYFDTSLEEREVTMNFKLVSPSGMYVWEFTGRTTTVNGSLYIGSADIAMPLDLQFEKGSYPVEITLNDGRVFATQITLD